MRDNSAEMFIQLLTVDPVARPNSKGYVTMISEIDTKERYVNIPLFQHSHVHVK